MLHEDDSAPRPIGPTLSAAQFWALMERWGVPDAVALDLIAFPGKMPQSGKRPRFRFITRQQRLASFLAEVDGALQAASLDPGWLHRKLRANPFGGRSPLQMMVERGAEGSAEVLRVLHRTALQKSLTTAVGKAP